MDYMFKKAIIVSDDELIEKESKVIVIGTVGDKKYTVRDLSGTTYTVMKESVQFLDN